MLKYNKLILFDVDHTLIGKMVAHRAAFEKALHKVYGVDTSLNIINYHGMTDQGIILAVLQKCGIEVDTIQAKMPECMNVMLDFFTQFIKDDNVIPLPGVKKLLRGLSDSNVLLGLVTGNLEPIARGKLSTVKLNNYFKLGGFGNEDAGRTNLVKLAIDRAKTQFAFTNYDAIYVVGDTPKDIKAGKEAGVKTIAVATGMYSEQELHHADFVFEDLTDYSGFLTATLLLY